MIVLHGVDISAYQSGPPRGKDFYVIKATEGISYSNSEMAGWLAEVESWGKLAGVYHFAHPTNDPTVEANFFLNHIRPHLKPGVLVCLDHETATGSAAHDAAWAVAFQRRVKAVLPAWTPVTYCDQAFPEAGRCAGLGWTALWLARYSAVTEAGIGPWSRSTLQQYSSSPEDEDVFFGTAADWRKLGGAGSAPAPAKPASPEEDDMIYVPTAEATVVPFDMGTVQSLIFFSAKTADLSVGIRLKSGFGKLFTGSASDGHPLGVDIGDPKDCYAVVVTGGPCTVLPADIALDKRVIPHTAATG
jgi:hypothetical protein